MFHVEHKGGTTPNNHFNHRLVGSKTNKTSITTPIYKDKKYSFFF